jgi:hypothetical protein
LVADEAMAQRLLGRLVPDGDSLVALSAAEVERPAGTGGSTVEVYSSSSTSSSSSQRVSAESQAG